MSKTPVGQMQRKPIKRLLKWWGGIGSRIGGTLRLSRAAYYYPLTISGTILLVLSLYLVGRSFATSNPYGFLLSASALVFLLVFSVLSRLQAGLLDGRGAEWDSSAPQYARVDCEHTLLLEKARSWPFFRIHFILSGPMRIGRGAVLHHYREVSTRGGRSVRFRLTLPLCGQLKARGRFVVKDMFGLTRARFGEGHERLLPVRPALLSDRRFPDVEALDGLEEKSKIKQSDVERYFMREYIPGDRIRDINWKASSRISELVTRIAPVTQEKTRVISVILRSFRRRRGETAASVAHLNHLKSWLFLFLKSIKHDRPEYQFRVTIGDDVFHLESEEDVEAFGLELSGRFFQNPPPDRGVDAAAQLTGEAFIFTTPYDDSLPVFLRALSGSNAYIFRTAVPSERDEGRVFRLFSLSDPVVFSSSWILSREGRLANPSVPMEHGQLLEEEPLEVRLA